MEYFGLYLVCLSQGWMKVFFTAIITYDYLTSNRTLFCKSHKSCCIITLALEMSNGPQGLACGNGLYSFKFCEQDLSKTKPVSLGKQEKRSFFGKFWEKIHSLKKPSGFQMHHRKSWAILETSHADQFPYNPRDHYRKMLQGHGSNNDRVQSGKFNYQYRNDHYNLWWMASILHITVMIATIV